MSLLWKHVSWNWNWDSTCKHYYNSIVCMALLSELPGKVNSILNLIKHTWPGLDCRGGDWDFLACCDWLMTEPIVAHWSLARKCDKFTLGIFSLFRKLKCRHIWWKDLSCCKFCLNAKEYLCSFVDYLDFYDIECCCNSNALYEWKQLTL